MTLMKIVLVLLVAAVLLLAIVVVDVLARWTTGFLTSRKIKKLASPDAPGVCETCASIDPVSDPAYNMTEIIKQSVLLEEHLTIDKKFCVDCVWKHLLHLHGLATEAVTLACSNVGEYPYLKDTPDFYQSCIDDWKTKVRAVDFVHDPGPRLELAAKLRNYRKKLTSAYL